MKNILLAIALVVVGMTSLFAKELEVPERPKPARLVNVFSKQPFISKEQVQALEVKLSEFNDSTSNQIAIVVVDDLNGLTANEFATKLIHEWGIGQAKKDNGVVLLLSLGGGTGNRDYYIGVGYGLEGAIPDLMVKRVQERDLLPYLKSGQYYEALDRTTTTLMALAKGEYNDAVARNGENDFMGMFFILAFFGLMLFLLMRAKKNGKIKDDDDDFFGGGGRGGGMFFPPFFPGGGFRGGGGGGGGFGGFGGFGGGSSGGGGAGGKW